MWLDFYENGGMSVVILVRVSTLQWKWSSAEKKWRNKSFREISIAG